MPRPALGASNDLRIGGRRSSSFFNLETRRNFSSAPPLIGLQHFFLLDRSYVFDRDFHTVDRTQDAAAHLVEGLGELV